MYLDNTEYPVVVKRTSLYRSVSDGSVDPGVFEKDNPAAGCVWRRINWYVAWLFSDSQIKLHFCVKRLASSHYEL